MKDIKILIMDVDGTLTDGSIYMGEHKEILKKFDVKDGDGIKNILPGNDIIPVIITGRNSAILQNRCRELGIKDVIQGCSDKKNELEKIIKKYNVSYSEVACIGDDLNDYEMMMTAGVRGCPSDAVKGIKDIANYITKKQGGYGAVREFIEWLVEKEN